MQNKNQPHPHSPTLSFFKLTIALTALLFVHGCKSTTNEQGVRSSSFAEQLAVIEDEQQATTAEKEQWEEIAQEETEKRQQAEDARRKAEKMVAEYAAEIARLKAEKHAAQRAAEEARVKGEEAEAEKLRAKEIRIKAEIEAAEKRKKDVEAAKYKIGKERLREEQGLSSLNGTVTITSDDGILSPRDVIITIESTDFSLASSKPPESHTIRIADKKFLPRYSIIRIDDTIIFENEDDFMHNVFSLTKTNKFDLGKMGSGLGEHTFHQSGLVKIYCGIHPKMACFIMVNISDWGTITGDDGRFEIPGLPAGEYILNAWNLRGEFTDTIEIATGEQKTYNIKIDTSQ